MNFKDIHLEQIPGINLGNEEEKKEAEAKANLNEQAQSEANKLQQGAAALGKKVSKAKSYKDNKTTNKTIF